MIDNQTTLEKLIELIKDLHTSYTIFEKSTLKVWLQRMTLGHVIFTKLQISQSLLLKLSAGNKLAKTLDEGCPMVVMPHNSSIDGEIQNLIGKKIVL